MTIVKQIWARLDQRGRIGLAFGVAAILALTSILGYWTLRQDYQVLFSGLAPQDAAAMVAELERMKVPYRIGEGGDTILVGADVVHKTRLKLLGKDIPLHGAVGFELFNNTDFGMTEFAQKVNYQRALQGEITRTILSIEEIQGARVHLALPEHTLFKKAGATPKASVTLTLKPGRRLAPDQVRGIQRLVAASVPDIRPEDVTLLDQHGVALSRQGGDEADLASGRLEHKRGMEDYLGRKLADVLDRSFGAGQAIATVDVVLGNKQVKVTTEDVLPANKPGADEAPTGIVVRERHTVRDGAAGKDGEQNEEERNNEIEYQVGRRIEQVESGPGAVERLSVAVVVRAPLGEEELGRLREIAANAVGFNAERGDRIAVYSMGRLPALTPSNEAATTQPPAEAAAAPASAAPTAARPLGAVPQPFWWVLAGLLGLGALLWFGARRTVAETTLAGPLDEAGRAAALRQVQRWLDQEAAEELR
ncbi:flagellar basal-body MS-ring/collar protein FliF [Chitinimonas lacunae]|uniref:Flagellar basal-body MS-ring/collar protein FliF n=1 Tax=Chitinimonas lacunae TaxID=1963018 RepID=A0ABV8MX27_9NEIS